MRRFFFAFAVLLAATPASAQLLDVLTAPKTLLDRAIEARSAGDIAKDNEIALKVDGAMADLGTAKASTEVYEQRLLVTGIFDDKALYDRFERDVRAIKGVKTLYWHVAYVAKDDTRRKQMLDWADTTAMETKAQGRLLGTAGVADVNFRTRADSFGTVYLLGRARSGEEAKKALARVKDGNGVRKVVSYVETRP
ncbi:MAG TPA: BON domain-containing protein [Magnetospirillum sp.]|jgi:hyperosmotically inducible protein|nr:BON domain-containing protein [Magnetospirillum sp.]